MPSTAACQAAASGNTAQYSWVVAVIICVAGGAVSNFGVNLQKLAHMRKALGAPARVYRVFWLLGFLGIVVGAIADFSALGFGAQSVVAPLGSMTLVANVVFAPLLLKERIQRLDLIGTALIIAGCVLAVLFASHKDCLFTLSELFEFYTTTRFWVYAAFVIAFILAFLVVIYWMERTLRRFGSSHAKYQRIFKLHRFSYACISGVAGAQSVLFAKTTVELLMDTIRGGALLFANGWTYLILFTMTSTITLQIYWMNCGLARWDATYNVPVFQAFWIFVSVIGGGVTYDEFTGLAAWQMVMFSLGIVATVAGVVMLSSKDAEVAQEARKRSTSFVPLLDTHQTNHPEFTVKFEEAWLGMAFVPSILFVGRRNHPDKKETIRVFTISEFLKDANGAVGPAERSGVLKAGDVLKCINKDNVWHPSLSHSDIFRRLTASGRPMSLTFMRISAPTPVSEQYGSSPTPVTPNSAGGVGALRSPRLTPGSNSASAVMSDAMAQDIAQVAGMGNDTGLMVVSSDAIESTNIVVPESDSLHRSATTAHSSLMHLRSLDPLSVALHTGQLVAPQMIDRDEAEVAAHPLVNIVERLFPSSNPSWKVFEAIVNTFDREQMGGRAVRRRHSFDGSFINHMFTSSTREHPRDDAASPTAHTSSTAGLLAAGAATSSHQRQSSSDLSGANGSARRPRSLTASDARSNGSLGAHSRQPLSPLPSGELSPKSPLPRGASSKDAPSSAV